MEVHHHPHVEKKNFKEYFLEFVMIFLAVTLGFFAENIREHITEKEGAKDYARSLIHDLKKDTAMVQVDINQMKEVISRIDNLADFLKNKEIKDLNNLMLYHYTRFECDYKPYSWSRATLDQIKSSGSLRYFPDDSLIMKISAYDAFTKHLDEDFNGDEARNDRVSEKRNNIVNLNYSSQTGDPAEHKMDSVLPYYFKTTNKNEQPDLQLLTDNINEIRSLVNDYLIIKKNFVVRSEYELPELIEEATEVIVMLKKEYNLK
jgi:hypothetical protein